MPAAEQLEQIARSLAAPASLAESRFLAIGQSLEQAVGILARLVGLCQTLLAELQSAELVQARQDLSAAAAHIDLFAGAQQGDVAALEQLAGMAAGLERRMAQMRAVGREVDVLAMNARLVASTMGEAGADFLLFVGGIRRSAALAQGSLAQIDAEMAAAAEHLSAARSSVASFAARNAEALHTIPRRLAANVAALDQRARLAGEATADVAKRSEDVARHVASAIVALQLGDITRQRVEHMQQAAGTLRQILAPEADSRFVGLSEAQQGAVLAVGCRLLAAQLLDTAEELDQEAERIGHRLDGLAADAREIGRLGEQAHAAADASHRSFLTALAADVRQTQALFEALSAAHADADRRIAAVLDTASRLAGHMATIRSVEADIHIMGLNTSLKCGRLGTIGRALGVIAQELRGCGTRTAAQAGAVLADSQRLLSLASALADSKQARHGATIDTVAEEMVTALGRLGRTGRSLAEALAGLERDSVAVAGLLDATAAEFAVRHDIGKVLRQAAADATALAEQVDRPGAEVVEATDRLLALLSQRYTMARERAVHAHGTSVPPGAAQAASACAEAELAEMLF
jgi:hypothetical protein